MFVGFEELLRVAILHQAEADEQAAEQQNFGRQKQPHTDFAGIELLLHGGEVMLVVGVFTMRMAVAVRPLFVRIVQIDCGCAHECGALPCDGFRPVIVGRFLEHRLVFEIMLDGRR